MARKKEHKSPSVLDASTTDELIGMVRRLRAHLVEDRKLLTGKQFDGAARSYFNFLGVLAVRPDLDFPAPPMMFWLDNAFPKLLVTDLLRARSAWYGVADRGFRGFIDQLGGNPRLLPIPAGFRPRSRIGASAVALGWTTKENIAHALKVQRVVEKETGQRLLVGSILAAFGGIDPVGYFQLIALSLDVPFDRFDAESLDAVKRKFLARIRPRSSFVG